MSEVTPVLLADRYATTWTALDAWLNPTAFMLLPRAAQSVDEVILLAQQKQPHILLMARHLLPRSPFLLLDGLWGALGGSLAERMPKLIVLAGRLMMIYYVNSDGRAWLATSPVGLRNRIGYNIYRWCAMEVAIFRN